MSGHPMPWAIVAYPKRRGYLCHRFVTREEAEEMRDALRRYWPGARLKVEWRA